MVVDGGNCHFGVESTVLDVYSTPPMILRPGGVTFEQLRELLPDLQVYQKSSNKEMELRPPTPGLKYRHYSPDAKVVLFEGESSAVHRAVIQAVEAALRDSKQKVGLIHTHPAHTIPPELLRHPSFVLEPLGDAARPELVARGIFGALRSLDEVHHCSAIFVEGIPEAHEGLAVMNRLRKAASETVHCSSSGSSSTSSS
jgi:L-threonylcarbamoyladenylate synthase